MVSVYHKFKKVYFLVSCQYEQKYFGREMSHIMAAKKALGLNLFVYESRATFLSGSPGR